MVFPRLYLNAAYFSRYAIDIIAHKPPVHSRIHRRDPRVTAEQTCRHRKIIELYNTMPSTAPSYEINQSGCFVECLSRIVQLRGFILDVFGHTNKQIFAISNRHVRSVDYSRLRHPLYNKNNLFHVQVIRFDR